MVTINSNATARSGIRLLFLAGVLGITASATMIAPALVSAQAATPRASSPNSVGTRLEPIFPAENTNLIFVEGEDAVVTNFDTQPVLNYSASGLRTLQLNSTAAPTGNAGYYADYVFYVDRPGTYELWYGGTPPGASESSKPSYSSPFEYTLDSESPVSVYSENVSVAGSYTPLYYWNKVGPVKLTAGRHQLRFQVTQKRRYDGKYLFYLDCFFLVREENGKAVPGRPLPSVFPSNLDAGKKGYPLKFVEDYLIGIRDHPANIHGYIELSLAYSLVGDNLNALKYLNRAGELDPKNESVAFLKAKNLLWKGDITKGLATYRAILDREPMEVNLWVEAGKVAAWTGRYSDSISFFMDGLKYFPNNLNLLVNLGLTYVWSGDEQKAQSIFTKARTSVSKDYSGLMRLAQDLSIAQAPRRAIEVYRDAIKAFPRDLEAYLSLEKLYLNIGKPQEAEAVGKQIGDTFVQSLRLTRFLDLARIKETLKSRLIADYERNLSKQPNNLGLRELLARAYFWNGMQEKGTAEYLSILINKIYRKLRETEKGSQNLVRLLDRSYVFSQYFQSAPDTARKLNTSLTAALAAYRAAVKKLTDYRKTVDTARQTGKAVPPPPNGRDPQEMVDLAERSIARDLAKADGFLEVFSAAVDDVKKDQVAVTKIRSKAEADQATFEKLIRSTKWHWRESDTMDELRQATGSGAPLGGYSMAKIDQIEGRLSSAADLFRKNLGTGDPLFRYELSQTLLWMGDIAQAAEEFRKLPAADTEQAAGRQWIDLVKSLASGAGAVGYSGSRPDERLIQDVQERLGAVPERARRILTTVTSLQSAMHGILRDRLLRAVYQNQEDTFQLRVDLGEYYLTQKRFNDAIRQFRQVLSIDPWNIGALFRLGRVYAMKGNWKQALANYEKVYYSDPTYENVLHRYNELARRHPDTFSFGVRSTSDTQRLIYQGSADFLTHLNSLFGLELNYTVGSQRLFVAPAPELPSTFQTNSVTLGVPIDLYGVHLKITPKFGVTVVNHLDGDTVARNLPTSTSLSPASYFGYLSLDPTARIDGALNIGKYLSITATYAYGRQPETYVPSRLRYNIFDNSAEMNVSTNLGFLGGYPFKSSSFRAYGRMDVLSDADIIYTALGELTLGIVNLQKFSTVISLVGNAQLQNSTRTPQPSYLYYAPKGEVVAGGGFQGSTWLPVGTDTLGLSLRAIASSYMQQIFSSANLTKLLQLSGEGRVEYDRGNSSVYLDTSFSATYQYDPVLAAPQSPWNYWSLAVSLGYSAQLPSLLTP